MSTIEPQYNDHLGTTRGCSVLYTESSSFPMDDIILVYNKLSWPCILQAFDGSLTELCTEVPLLYAFFFSTLVEPHVLGLIIGGGSRGVRGAMPPPPQNFT